MRCQYCHNPDTWRLDAGEAMTAEQILEEYRKNKTFYRKGGITVTGGEPLLQIDFLLDLFRLAKQEGVHTCLDTSGVTYRETDSAYQQKLDRLLDMTDLVLLDVKHTDPEKHTWLTGHGNEHILKFARYLDQKKIPVWIRHVLIPGITDGKEHLQELGKILAGLRNVKALDVLPYHTMGVSKYQQLGMPYPLEGIEPATKAQVADAKKIILESYRHNRT